MKSLKGYFIVALATSLFAVISCKKDKGEGLPAAPPVIGIWQGAVTSENKPTALKMDIKSDGTVVVTAQSVALNGNWTFNSNEFEAKFSAEGIQATAKGELSADKKTIKGTWSEEGNGKISTRDLEVNKN